MNGPFVILATLVAIALFASGAWWLYGRKPKVDWRDLPPTDKQLDYIHDLADDRGLEIDILDEPDTRGAASELIDKLLAMPEDDAG